MPGLFATIRSTRGSDNTTVEVLLTGLVILTLFVARCGDRIVIAADLADVTPTRAAAPSTTPPAELPPLDPNLPIAQDAAESARALDTSLRTASPANR